MFIVHYFSVWKRGEGQGTKINYKMIVYKNIKENKFSIKKKTGIYIQFACTIFTLNIL